MKKTMLVILDGFGINEKTPAENAIIQAKAPYIHGLLKQLHTKLDASGRAVGLPDGQMGNSEVGHMTIGTGRIIKQNLVEIQDMMDDGTFFKLPEFIEGINHCQKNGSNLHILHIFGPGGVHGMDTHLESLIPHIPEDVTVLLHLFTDGRDLGPKTALELMKEFETFLEDYPNIKIATLGGRYYGMDRDNNRERVHKAYDEIVFGQMQTSDKPSEYIAKSYARELNNKPNEKEITDEFLIPVGFMDAEQIEDGDAVFFLNFRSDRARQLTQALMVSCDPEEAKKYPTWDKNFLIKKLRNIYLVTMTKYYKEYEGKTFIKESDIKNTLGETISKAELRQLHIAETEKFAHVTKFFNGDRQIVYNGEKDILVPSHKVATYDLDPEMSAQEIFDQCKEHAKDYDFVIMNFANGDMVGHTGIMNAAITAVQKLDTLVEQLVHFAKENKFELLMTADHGNCEEMGTSEEPKTAHTTNLVPFRWISDGKVQASRKLGGLADIAPTVLHLMDIKVPKEMTGLSLVD